MKRVSFSKYTVIISQLQILRNKLFYRTARHDNRVKVQSLCVECFPDTRTSVPWYMQMVWIFYNTSNTAVLTSTLLLGSLLPLSTYISFVLVIKAREYLTFYPTVPSPNGEGSDAFKATDYKVPQK